MTECSCNKHSANCLASYDGCQLQRELPKPAPIDEVCSATGEVSFPVHHSPFLCLQGELVEDFADISRERLERTFKTNIIGMIRSDCAAASLRPM